MKHLPDDLLDRCLYGLDWRCLLTTAARVCLRWCDWTRRYAVRHITHMIDQCMYGMLADEGRDDFGDAGARECHHVVLRSVRHSDEWLLRWLDGMLRTFLCVPGSRIATLVVYGGRYPNSALNEAVVRRVTALVPFVSSSLHLDLSLTVLSADVFLRLVEAVVRRGPWHGLHLSLRCEHGGAWRRLLTHALTHCVDLSVACEDAATAIAAVEAMASPEVRPARLYRLRLRIGGAETWMMGSGVEKIWTGLSALRGKAERLRVLELAFVEMFWWMRASLSSLCICVCGWV